MSSTTGTFSSLLGKVAMNRADQMKFERKVERMVTPRKQGEGVRIAVTPVRTRIERLEARLKSSPGGTGPKVSWLEGLARN